MKLIALCLTTLALVACGGGGGDSAPPAASPSAEGFYGGALTGSASTAFQMLILENGDAWSIYGTNLPNAFLVAGFVQGSGSSTNGSYSGTGKDYGFAPGVAGTVAATYDAAAKTISGTTTTVNGTTTFVGGPVAGSLYNYETPASLATVIGSWTTASLTGETVTFNIAANGTFSAVSSLGCNFTGTVAPRASGKNVFDTALTFGPAPCALPGQSASGIAVAYPLANGQTQLIVGAVDSTRTFGTAAFGTR
jgi:hypothetical protein